MATARPPLVYLDTNVLLSLVLRDVHTGRAEAILASDASGFVISDLAVLEFRCVIGRRVRNRDISEDSGHDALAILDMLSGTCMADHLRPDDIPAALELLRNFSLGLRMADCLHLVAARRLGAAIASFDAVLLRSARALGVPLHAAAPLTPPSPAPPAG